MIRVFCDKCKEEITDANSAVLNSTITPGKNDPTTVTIGVEGKALVIALEQKPNEPDVQAGDFCRNCIFDSFDALRTRPSGK